MSESANAQGVITGNGDDPRALVVVFLRGAADGLNMAAPVEDDDYHRLRPTIGVSKKDALQLDGFFGLNPAMKDLAPMWNDGSLALIHAAGSEDQTRSHFEAQDLMEHGGYAGGGWLGRFLRFQDRPASNALAAIAIGRAVPESLRGAPAATVMESIDDFSLGAGRDGLALELGKLYAAEGGELAEAARDTLDALSRINALRGKPYSPEGGADYPKDEFGGGMAQIARLIKTRVGLQAATIDLGNWDSHFAQSTLMDPLMERLAKGLRAFSLDMGRRMATTTVVVMSEFGRRAAENASFGTDHGRGGLMMIAGGGVKGGRVVGEWPGLKPAALADGLDLAVAQNYRDALAPILQRHGDGADLKRIFPEYEIKPLALHA